MLTTAELPVPSADGLAHSAELTTRIRKAISDAGGALGFDRYMQMALYEPGLGYYLGGAIKFGVDGDFVTAPELSPLFGRCIARQIQPLLVTLGCSIFEFGAGNGLLAASVLNALGEQKIYPSYRVLELSAEMRRRQRDNIERLAPQHYERVAWVDDVAEAPLNGVILANEIIDAFPVKRFKVCAGEIFECCVTAEKEQFVWRDLPASPELKRAIAESPAVALCTHEEVYVSEINTGIEPWIADLARLMGRAVAFIIDYGFVEREYYLPERALGTLLCHYRHRAHSDPFYYPGLQDITASVDFTRVANAADACGLTVRAFAEQSRFFLAKGLLDEAARAAEGGNERAQARVAYETKVLTLPNEMGARFKVLALAKGYTGSLGGFEIRDDRHRL